MYEVFPHTADLGLRIKAGNVNALFAEAGRALFHVIVGDLDQVRSNQQIEYSIDGTAYDYLLFDWLNELLYTFETQHMLLAQFEVSVDEHGMKAVAQGEPIDRSRHQLEHEVKAITYHDLKVQPAGDGWLAEVILDI